MDFAFSWSNDSQALVNTKYGNINTTQWQKVCFNGDWMGVVGLLNDIGVWDQMVATECGVAYSLVLIEGACSAGVYTMKGGQVQSSKGRHRPLVDTQETTNMETTGNTSLGTSTIQS